MRLFCIVFVFLLFVGTTFGQTTVACQDILSATVTSQVTKTDVQLAGKMVPLVTIGLYSGYIFPDTKIQVAGKLGTVADLKRFYGKTTTFKVHMLILNGHCGGRSGYPGTFTSITVR